MTPTTRSGTRRFAPIVHDALVKWKNAMIAHGDKP